MINILIRTSNRPALFKRCINSIMAQTHKDYNIIVSYDNDEALKYIPCEAIALKVQSDPAFPYYWNLYCNSLKDQVVEGWFFFLDDDDFLRDKEVLRKIDKHLTDPSKAVICQFLRWGVPKPSSRLMDSKQIIRGYIGMPCLFLHHTKKDIASFDGYPAADYRFIKAVSEKIEINFVKTIVVQTDRISKGKCSTLSNHTA